MLEIAIEIIAIMFCISGIIFGIGEIFDNENLKNFAKLEVLETFFNSFLVASAFLLFGNNGIVQRVVNEIANTSNKIVQVAFLIIMQAASLTLFLLVIIIF